MHTLLVFSQVLALLIGLPAIVVTTVFGRAVATLTDRGKPEDAAKGVHAVLVFGSISIVCISWLVATVVSPPL